jgi:hypothetical protein
LSLDDIDDEVRESRPAETGSSVPVGTNNVIAPGIIDSIVRHCKDQQENHAASPKGSINVLPDFITRRGTAWRGKARQGLV